MAALLLGLGAAVTYGAADFIGGLAARRNDALTVVLGSQLFGTALLLALAPLFLDGSPSARTMGWGAAAGVAGIVGVVLLYRGLAIGRMSVVAPLTAVLAAAAPVVFGLISGERPGAVALLGVVVALVAVLLISLAPPPEGDETGDADVSRRAAPGVIEAVFAGVGFGLFFILLDEAGSSGDLWPLVGSRAASCFLITAAVLIKRPGVRPAPGSTMLVLGSGVGDVAANGFYLLATRHGLLSLVAVLTSLYPASTVLLARTVLGERLTRPQTGGLALAVCGVVLIAVG